MRKRVRGAGLGLPQSPAPFLWDTGHVYSDRIKAVVSTAERKILSRLASPRLIQDYLDKLPINFETDGETYMSPRRVFRTKTAHCFEGALVAAAAFAYHGQKPLLLDLKTASIDEDHVVTLFMWNGRWGAISKTNHVTLRYRDPVYASPREVAMSYFHEYYWWNGKKTLRSFSLPFDLSKFSPESWVTPEEDLFWLTEKLDSSKHIAVATPKQLRSLRDATRFEIKTTYPSEWPDPAKGQKDQKGQSDGK